jgi:hypothetical protein
VIVVVGNPLARLDTDGNVRAAGMAADTARVAASTGASVQLVGRIGEGPVGDGVLLDLAQAGVGHVASLRDASHVTPLLLGDDTAEAGADDADVAGELLDEPLDEPDSGDGHDDRAGDRPDGGARADSATSRAPGLDAGDLDLALRYLREFRAIVLTESIDPDAAAAVNAIAGWSEVPIVALIAPGGSVPAGLEGATVLEAPADDPDGSFAALVGRFAAALDSGDPPDAAFRAATAQVGWASSPD